MGRVGRTLLSVVAWAGLASAAAAQTPASTAVKHETWPVAGLDAPAQLIVDHWGIPHIFAASSRDAFFLQGYNAARDRLWQIDLWRKRGLGRLAASFGPAYVAQDRAARLFLYRGDMAAEWAAYAPGSRESVEAFAAGVNAYVAEVQAGTKPLPVEFKLTGSQPEMWAPEDILRIRSHALVSNVTSEVARAQVACAAGLAADRLRRKLEPAHTTVVPAGLDPCVVPADVLKNYLLATEQVSFEALATGGRQAQASPPKSPPKTPQVQLAEAMTAYENEGSNNWVIAPSRTATGRPILANDPHRTVTVPSLRYIVHLNAPDLDIIGAGEPALPGVSFGHNRQIAWGLTIFYIDQEDLYVYDTPSSGKNGGDSYRYKSGYEPMKVVHETIEVKGQAPRDVTLKFTRHGPVIDETPDTGKGGHAFAMRTVWNLPGASGYFGSSRLWRAKSWADFKAGEEHWGVPPLNLVFADTTGDIGWSAAGLTPARPNWDGLLPVPGDGRYEWAGMMPESQLPALHNPPRGFVATANQMNLPADYPAGHATSYEWADRSRITRIEEVLAAQPKATLADSMALQTDSHDTLSRRAIALLRPLSSPDPQVRKALDLLRAWDNDETTGSVAAAIYQVWVSNHLGHTVVAAATPEAARSLVGSGNLDAVVSYLETPEAAATRDALLLGSLTAAVNDLKRGLGPDMALWTWGRLHHAQFHPAAGVLADRQLAEQMATARLEVPGSGQTPRAATYRPDDFTQTAGASVRLVMDVGAWDNSVAVNTPGQSGDPFSVHYRDLFPLWASGAYAPLDFSRAAVDRDAELVVSLEPRK
ncbi:MAG TPA: penicillin acylase family protein [Phenylobacterium sp.]|uniref:penicillin acylase family protein n=1 Tax=Phenylobacterium sp. TaxID=1871053 RepID=UPI002D54AFFF|nr:penicillin acylase family protein [Phenylobacterium sp.]HZZ69156.1 penicillin acylase family protein [Phenylobacterium sp.]